jgi:hypothetical protein
VIFVTAGAARPLKHIPAIGAATLRILSIARLEIDITSKGEGITSEFEIALYNGEPF